MYNVQKRLIDKTQSHLHITPNLVIPNDNPIPYFLCTNIVYVKILPNVFSSTSKHKGESRSQISYSYANILHQTIDEQFVYD